MNCGKFLLRCNQKRTLFSTYKAGTGGLAEALDCVEPKTLKFLLVLLKLCALFRLFTLY